MSKRKILVVLILISAICLFSLTSCTSDLPIDRAFRALTDATEHSLTYATYFIEEWVLENNVLDKTTVNVRCDLDKEYRSIAEGDTYRDYKVNVFVSRKDRDVKEIYCGPANCEDKNAPKRNTLFEIEFGYENNKRIETDRRQTFMTTEEFTAGEEFLDNFSLGHFLSELRTLQIDDLDFSIKNAKREWKNNVVTLSFGVRDTYVARFDRQKAKRSVFADSTRVEIEIIYGRIASLIVYREYTDERSGLILESEPYKLFVNYYGPKFDMPVYSTQY